ncbi:hypothetical protein [Dactylosporangium sp. NPDC048998]|uniref:hypothetical protein n=1 Tax=Dactylosporangium sp. NPDC048998 TaxID=3363976 RepID=UPI00371B26E3
MTLAGAALVALFVVLFAALVLSGLIVGGRTVRRAREARRARLAGPARQLLPIAAGTTTRGRSRNWCACPTRCGSRSSPAPSPCWARSAARRDAELPPGVELDVPVLHADGRELRAALRARPAEHGHSVGFRPLSSRTPPDAELYLRAARHRAGAVPLRAGPGPDLMGDRALLRELFHTAVEIAAIAGPAEVDAAFAGGPVDPKVRRPADTRQAAAGAWWCRSRTGPGSPRSGCCPCGFRIRSSRRSTAPGPWP